MNNQHPGQQHVRRQRLLTEDGTIVEAAHLPATSGNRDLAVVVAHGFTLHSRHPLLQQIGHWISERVGVVHVDLRGHGGSTGTSTLGWQEVHDVEAAVAWARCLGYHRVVTLGFSLGAAVVVRHGALHGGVDRIAAVSGPSQWYYRGTSRMRLLHQLVLTRSGRLALRMLRRTYVTHVPWTEPLPIDPVAAAGQLDVPLLVVHGDRDHLFPIDHAQRVSAAAGELGTLWLEPGFGHAEKTLDAGLARRLTSWLATPGHVPR
ncbi:alpha/beta fold hydrolase [Actinobacteria bacterium YIM 96077]|uniref:Alpha/beta hydrolase n=1 Tax=Phytoactinopolyspora halophila TaxID=1981511 RepID=A0A329QGV5_9ACTN|nr:alpha/beta fold hydrolase [Phytoactinopolyspora halophila]AYY12679.1 alpha/beta fold hydrolase [Actinobacteria bacterium YIM 96077]RAW10592.1 alpha/beta hydrolase [Phytoactinopolyspora halophila]